MRTYLRYKCVKIAEMDNMSCDNGERSGSHNVLTIDDHIITTGSRTRHTHKKTRLTCLVVCIVVIVILIAAICAIFYFKSKECTSGSSIKECTTAKCVHTASVILDKMDKGVDPCQDFSQFACGRFYKNTLIPDDQSYHSVYSIIANKNTETVRLILQADNHPEEKKVKSYVTKMKEFYNMCLDTDTINKVGLKPYLDSDYPEDWPTLNPHWNSTFDLNDVTAKYESLLTGNDNLFGYIIGPDFLQSSKNILKISQPEHPLGTVRLRSSPRNDSAILALQNYYVDIALALGADDVTALEDAKKLVDFEISLALMSNLPEERSNKSLLYNPMTLDEMSKKFPPIDWQRIFQGVFQSAGISVEGNITVINESPNFFVSLGELLKSTPNRVLQNMYSFHYAEAMLKDLTPAMRDASLRLKKHTLGITELNPRWTQCVKEVKDIFHSGLAKQFVSRTFSQQSKTFIQRMIVNLKTSFHQQIENTSWMGQKTKEAAFRKLDYLTYQIGYPDTNFDDPYIDSLYSNITITKDRFCKTRLELLHQRNVAKLRKITRDVDKSNWQGLSMEINMENVFELNEIRFYAGILQPNFFSEAFPSSINYGAVGSAIAHELTHFFDNEGSQYDEHGNLRDWWEPQDLQQFKKRIQCLVDQYSAFQVSEISTNLNGKLTVGENTADNGGIKAAFSAYKEFSTSIERELPLPGLGLTLHQQFFVGFGQAHCSLHTKNDLKELMVDVHPPGKYRMLGTLRNNVDFSEAFNCPVGSPMNPVKKCSVW